MKKHFAIIALAIMSLQTAVAQVITMTIDSMQLFSYQTELGIEKAIRDELIEKTGVIVYREIAKHWTINKEQGYVHFWGENLPILRYENEKIVYQTGDGLFRILMMKDRKSGRDMVVYLEPDLNGITRGGYGYPRNLTTTGGQ